MLLFRLGLLACAGVLGAAAAHAAEPQGAGSQMHAQSSRAEIHVCDPADAPRHMRKVLYSRREFVTAEQVLAGQAPQGAPVMRCITPTELERLRTLRPGAFNGTQVAALKR